MTTSPQEIIRLTFGQMMQALDRCRNIYTQLIEAAETKHKLIMAGRADELGSFAKVENELLDKFAEYERSMRNAAVKLQRALGMETDEPASLTEIRYSLEEEQQAELLQMQQQLNQLAKRLYAINENNQLMLKQDLALTYDILDLFLGSVESDYIYDNPKALSQTKRPSGIDYRT